jgi:hypothetical protein
VRGNGSGELFLGQFWDFSHRRSSLTSSYSTPSHLSRIGKRMNCVNGLAQPVD